MAAAPGQLLPLRAVLLQCRRRMDAWFRVALVAACAAAYLLLRQALMGAGGATSLRGSGLLRRTENPYAFPPTPLAAALSNMYLHFRYGWLLLWPSELCAEYSYNCVPVVELPSDPRAAHGVFFHAVLWGGSIAMLLSRRLAVLLCTARGFGERGGAAEVTRPHAPTHARTPTCTHRHGSW